MSFLDEDQATAGRISLGTRRAGLESLLPRRRRQTARQQQVSGYDILPSTMQPIPGVVSTPTDIARVGVDVSQQLQQQGTTAAQVPNVFERYAEGAAPIGDFRQYLYPTSPAPEDEEQNDLPEATDEEFAENFGIDPYDPQTPMGQLYSDQEAAAEAAAGRLSNLYSGLDLGSKTVLGLEAQGLFAGLTGKDSEAAIVGNIFDQAENGTLTDADGAKITVDDVWGHFAEGPQAPPVGGGSGIAAIAAGGGRGGVQAAATGPAPATSTPSDPSISVNDGGNGDGGDGGTGFGSGGIEAAAAAGVFASGGIVTKSKTKNKTSFMSMKGK